MKRIVLIAAALSVSVLFSGIVVETLCAKELKIGYVDLVKVFDEYNRTKESSKVVEDKAKGKEAERNKLIDEIKKMKDEQTLLSDKAKNEKQAAIDVKIKSLQEFDVKTREELVKDRQNAINDIMKDIEKTVNDYSKDGGYDLVLNDRILLYKVPQFDLTAEILKKLNTSNQSKE
jgi:Skp family chaperone for outer membrane proteins